MVASQNLDETAKRPHSQWHHVHHVPLKKMYYFLNFALWKVKIKLNSKDIQMKLYASLYRVGVFPLRLSWFTPGSPASSHSPDTGNSAFSIGVHVSVGGCLSLYVAPQQTGNLSKVWPRLHPKTAGIDFSTRQPWKQDRTESGWMSRFWCVFHPFKNDLQIVLIDFNHTTKQPIMPPRCIRNLQASENCLWLPLELTHSKTNDVDCL